MARTRKGSTPAYRYHKARNCAVVTINGRDYYLGPFGSPLSKEKYASLILAWESQQELPELDEERKFETHVNLTVNDLILAYLKLVQGYYKPNHGRNFEAGCAGRTLNSVRGRRRLLRILAYAKRYQERG